MKASDQFRAGDALLGGAAVVIAVKGDYVLCVLTTGNDSPFVTWWVDGRGQVLSGAYHKELGDAVRDLTARAYRASGEAV